MVLVYMKYTAFLFKHQLHETTVYQSVITCPCSIKWSYLNKSNFPASRTESLFKLSYSELVACLHNSEGTFEISNNSIEKKPDLNYL